LSFGGGIMQHYSATSVQVLADTDHSEGWVVFRWAHDVYGYEELRIDLDGHCSRRMPSHSGSGPPEFVELRRDRVKLGFGAELARKLRLDEEVEISFSLLEPEFQELRRVIDYFGEAQH
jgi:hypothetical protein